MKLVSVLAWIPMALLAIGCSASVGTEDGTTDSSETSEEALRRKGGPVQEVLPGGDRDAHGCIGSAGYSWCGKEKACARPWELAASKGFPNNRAAFDAYCNVLTPPPPPPAPLPPPPPAPPPPGSDRDAHGCIGSAGYSWCVKENSCVQPWVLAKSKGFELSLANFNGYCGNPRTVTPTPAGPTPEPVQTTEPPAPGSDRDAHGCIGSAGYSWCTQENACVQPWILAASKQFENSRSAFDAYCKN